MKHLLLFACLLATGLAAGETPEPIVLRSANMVFVTFAEDGRKLTWVNDTKKTIAGPNLKMQLRAFEPGVGMVLVVQNNLDRPVQYKVEMRLLAAGRTRVSTPPPLAPGKTALKDWQHPVDEVAVLDLELLEPAAAPTNPPDAAPPPVPPN